MKSARHNDRLFVEQSAIEERESDRSRERAVIGTEKSNNLQLIRWLDIKCLQLRCWFRLICSFPSDRL